MMVLQHRRRKSSTRHRNARLLDSTEAALSSGNEDSDEDEDENEPISQEEPEGLASLFVEVNEKAREIDGEGTVVFSRGGEEGRKRESIATFTFAPIPTSPSVILPEDDDRSSSKRAASTSSTSASGPSKQWDAAGLAKLVRAQSHVRRFLAQKLSKRLKVVRELEQTESRYISSMRLLVKLFIEPLEARVTEGRPIIEPQIVLDIFSCIRELLELHEAFLQRLVTRLGNLSAFRANTIADIFLLHTKFLLLYPFYVNNFTVASATLKKVKANNPEFAEFVRQRERRSEMKLQDVESLLLMPVQRIPQYTLLLQDLLKQCKPKTSLHADLSLALQHLRDCLSHINEQKRDAENAAQLEVRLKHFVYRSKKDALPQSRKRRLLGEGPVTFYQKSKGKKLWLFVLSDALVMAKPKKKPNKDTSPRGAASPSSPQVRSPRPTAQQAPAGDHKVEHIVYLKELNMLSIPSTAPVGDEGRFSVHGRGLKLEFGVKGGPRAAEAWVRTIQLSLLAYQHQAKRKFLKTTMRRSVKSGPAPGAVPSGSPRDAQGSNSAPLPAVPSSPSASGARASLSDLFSSRG